MKISKSRLREIVKEVINEESDYQEFFKKALEKTGKSIPQMSDEEKKAFFNKIDKAWKGKGEKSFQKMTPEGNAFGAAVTKAKEQGKDTFKVGGKTYKVESVVSEAMFDKNKLMKLMRKYDDALIRTNKGKEFIIYSPFSNNDDNASMWGNDSVIAIDKNSDEHKIRYRDIVKFIGESAVNEQSSNRDIMAISRMTGVPDYKIEDFVRKHKLKDLKKVKKLVKGMGSKKDERFAQIVGGKFSMVSDFKEKYKNS